MKVLESAALGPWVPIYLASEIDRSADGSFVRNDLGVTMEFTNDPSVGMSIYEIPSGISKTIPIPGQLWWRVQDPNRTRTVTARQVQL